MRNLLLLIALFPMLVLTSCHNVQCKVKCVSPESPLFGTLEITYLDNMYSVGDTIHAKDGTTKWVLIDKIK